MLFVRLLSLLFCFMYLSCNESQAQPSRYEMSDSNLSKVISFPKGSFKFNPFNRPMLEGSYYFFNDTISKLNVSFIIQKRWNRNSEDEIIDKMMRDDKMMGTLTLQEKKEINGMHSYVYRFSKYGEDKIDQLNSRSIVFFDDYWLDIHISLMNPKEDDLNKIVSFLGSVKFENKPRNFVNDLDSVYDQTALFSFIYANECYNKKDYKNAISAYKTLIRLLMQAKMQHEFCIVAYDNLGMAFALTGDIRMAKRTFEEGVKFDPNYPNFYYNLGCCYAESGDFAAAVDYLEKAFARKSHVLPEESMPDPFTDDSFKKMFEDKAILAKVKAFAK